MNLNISIKLLTLLVTLAISMCILCSCSSPAQPVTPTPTPTNTEVTPTSSPSSSEANMVEVVYFHRAQRCSGCIYAGDTTEYTVETYFADKLASGKLVFKMLNLQNPANAAIVEKYGAYTSSLFINDIKGGIDHIEEVIDIWFLLHNDEQFVNLVKGELEKHLGE